MMNMRIGTRLIFGFGIVVGLSIVLGIYALGKQSAVQSLTESMNARDFASVEAMRRLNFGENQMQSEREAVLVSAFERKERLTGDPPEIHETGWLNLRDQNLKALADLENSMAGWASTSATAQRAAAWRRIRASLHDAREALSAVSPEVEKQFSLIQQGNIAEAVGQTASVQQVIGAYQARLAEVQRTTEEQINLGKTEVAQAAEETRDSIAAVLAITVAVGLISAVFIQRSITRPLSEFVTLVERVGQGDLTQQPEVSRR